MADETASARNRRATGRRDGVNSLSEQLYSETSASHSCRHDPRLTAALNSSPTLLKLTFHQNSLNLAETHRNSPQVASLTLSRAHPVLQTSVGCARSSQCWDEAAQRTSAATDRYHAARHHPAGRLRAGWAGKNTDALPSSASAYDLSRSRSFATSSEGRTRSGNSSPLPLDATPSGASLAPSTAAGVDARNPALIFLGV